MQTDRSIAWILGSQSSQARGNDMTKPATIALFLALLVAGCHSPISTPAPLAIVPPPVSDAAIGTECMIQTRVSSDAVSTTYQGTLLRFDDAQIVLSDPTRTCRRESATPILGDLPIVGRHFRNVGIGREQMQGNVTVDRKDVISVTMEQDDATAPDAEKSRPRRPN